MSTDMNKYETAANATIVAMLCPQKSRTSEMIRGEARKCDQVLANLQMATREMAKRFDKYASKVATGDVSDVPTRYSALNDIEECAATFKARLESLKTLILLEHGVDAVAKFIDLCK